MKKKRFADFCVDQIDVIMNSAVITNVVLKRVRCKIFNYLNIWPDGKFSHSSYLWLRLYLIINQTVLSVTYSEYW